MTTETFPVTFDLQSLRDLPELGLGETVWEHRIVSSGWDTIL
ncbi:hypothetical protein [Cognatiyoonia sp. IB215182]|nr:hypothetical protein [Cognatiyoonia sp. IB215182]